MESIIGKLVNDLKKPNLTLEEITDILCKIYEEEDYYLDDTGITPSVTEDQAISDWVHNKHPEWVELFEKNVNTKCLAGAYLYALVTEEMEEKEEEEFDLEYIRKIIALYYYENPDALARRVEGLEGEYGLNDDYED